jgi:thymidylate synthase
MEENKLPTTIGSGGFVECELNKNIQGRNTLDKKYQELLKDILDNGIKKSDRTGTGTISVFGRQIRHKMSEGFPLLTTKKMYWKGIVTELLWFLRGDTNIKYLVDNDCHIWDGDVYKSFMIKNGFKKTDLGWEGKMGGLNQKTHAWLTQEEFINKIKTDADFAKKWGDLGPIYGKQWRKWNKIRFRDINRINQHHNQIAGIENPFEEEGKWVRGYEDQIANLINDLKTNPDSRRLMVSAWNVGELDQMTLPPCHYGFQVYTRELSLEERVEIYGVEKIQTNNAGWYEYSLAELDVNQANIPKRAISLMWNQRSCDFPLGIPMNISSYALLLTIIAKEVNMVPDELIGNLGDCHIYLNQIEGVKEQIGREPYPLPKLLCLDEYHYLMDKELVGEIPFSEKIEKFRPDFFTLENYQSHPKIYFPLSN